MPYIAFCVCMHEKALLFVWLHRSTRNKKTRSRFIYFSDILKRQMQLIRFFSAHSHETKGKEWKEKWCSDNSGISLLSINYIIATKVSIQIWLDHRASEREEEGKKYTKRLKKVRFTSIPCDTIDFNEYWNEPNSANVKWYKNDVNRCERNIATFLRCSTANVKQQKKIMHIAHQPSIQLFAWSLSNAVIHRKKKYWF